MCVCVCQGVRHTSSNGGAKDLVHMRVFELEGAMFEDKIEDGLHYMGRWAVCGYYNHAQNIREKL